jgi:signal transduction histidine kinase/ligand-binding sensor domain-containing protein
LCLLIPLVFTSQGVRAEQFPVRVYTAADGLPRDSVFHVEQDSRGFLWVLTGDGLTRFDGYDFVTYTTDDGLPDRRVNDLLETRGGAYWLATSGGLCRFNPRGAQLRNTHTARQFPASPQSPPAPTQPRTTEAAGGARAEPMFVLYNPDGVEGKAVVFNVLWEDEAGVIWGGTDRGLYRLEDAGGRVRFELVDLGRLTGSRHEGVITAVVKDRRGSLWVASDGSGLYRLLPDGRAERYTTEHGLPADKISSLTEDRDGNVWVGVSAISGGLCRLVPDPEANRPVVARSYTKKDGLPSGWVNSLRQTRDGKLWVGTSEGLTSLASTPGAGESSFQAYDVQEGFCDKDVWGLSEDRDGNLWIASRCGLSKVANNGFTTYGTADGLGNPFINSIFETREGELIVVNASVGADGRGINRFDTVGFTSVAPRLPSVVKYHGWGWGQTIIQDHAGEWWVPTGGTGLFLFPRVESFEQLGSAGPKVIYPMREGARAREVFRLYEDGRGDIWIATTGVTGLVRWERSTGVFHELAGQTGVPPGTDFTVFREDSYGNLWIGTAEEGGLLRYRDGRFRRFTADEGVPPGWIISLHLDHAGRLWVASQLGGLNRIDDPSAESLHFVRYTTADGLSSNNIRSITEDAWGRIYAGTGRGVDRLDPETGRIKHYTAADGLPRNTIEHAYRDRHGALWFGSPFGVSRFVPRREETERPPSIYIVGLTVEGVARPVSELGETELPPLELSPSQNQLSIAFGGLSFNLGEELQYQYKLEGAGGEWGPPSVARVANYPNLPPGAYRFAVRAVSADGQASPTAATFSFTVLAPVWRRPWFVALSMLATGLAAYAFYRHRIARLLEVANMRTRIATDLHDDIGADLTKISILSEVARQQGGGGGRGADDTLSSIARISRESVASMSDIVWAIDPKRDNLLDLVRRMRRHAEDVFAAPGITLEFNAPGADERLNLGADMRRGLFLIFKEAVNNAARHSGCAGVKIDFRADSSGFLLRVADDGVGFDPSAESEGQGLTSMRKRARSLGATLDVESRAGGGGTAVRLRVRNSHNRHAL